MISFFLRELHWCPCGSGVNGLPAGCVRVLRHVPLTPLNFLALVWGLPGPLIGEQSREGACRRFNSRARHERGIGALVRHR
jgi:hypothetical protein